MKVDKSKLNIAEKNGVRPLNRTKRYLHWRVWLFVPFGDESYFYWII